MAEWKARLAELGLDLPPFAKPIGAYTPALRTGNYVYTSGQLNFRGDGSGELTCEGKVGDTVDVDSATAAARLCALNALAAIDDVVGLDSIVRIVKVTGFVASAPGFTAQPTVLNGASGLFADVFGDAGVHVRAAVGVAELPIGAPVEIELIVEVAS